MQCPHCRQVLTVSAPSQGATPDWLGDVSRVEEKSSSPSWLADVERGEKAQPHQPPDNPAPRQQDRKRSGVRVVLALLLVSGTGAGAWWHFHGSRRLADAKPDKTAQPNDPGVASIHPTSAKADRPASPAPPIVNDPIPPTIGRDSKPSAPAKSAATKAPAEEPLPNRAEGPKRDASVASKNSDAASRDLEPLLGLILGEELPTYQQNGYKQYEFGSSFDVIDGMGKLRWTAINQPYTFWNKASGEEEFIFDDKKELVHITKYYHGGADDYANQLAEVFGKTNQEINKSHSVRFDGSVVSRVTARYHFPKTLVQVVFGIQDSGRKSTAVIVANKRWLMGILNQNMRDKQRNVRWLRDVARRARGGQVDIASIPKLDGTELREEEKARTRILNFIDKKYDVPNQGKKDNRLKIPPAAAIEIQSKNGKLQTAIHFSFDCYSPNATSQIFRQPPMRGGGVYKIGNNALNLTQFSALVTEANAALLQVYFPSRQGTINLVTPDNSYQRPFYEWQTEDGWRVICGFNDAVTLEEVEVKKL